MSKKKIILLLFTGILIFTGMLHLQSFSLIEQSRQYAEYGYLEMNNVYSMYGNEFKYNYNDLNSMVDEIDESFDSFNLVVVHQNSKNKWIYTKNKTWNIPLLSGSAFTENENQSTQQFCISNNPCENKLGKPLLSDQSNYYNLKSLQISEKSINNYIFYSDTALNGFTKMNDISEFVYRSYEKLYSLLYFLTCSFLVIFMFMLYYRENVNLIAIRKFLGHSVLSMFCEYSSNIILIILSSFIVAILIFFLLNPLMLQVELFKNQIMYLILKTGLLVVLFIVIVNTYIFFKIKTTDVIHVLREVDS